MQIAQRRGGDVAESRLELLVCLSREADDEVGAEPDAGYAPIERLDHPGIVADPVPAPHPLQDRIAPALQRDLQMPRAPRRSGRGTIDQLRGHRPRLERIEP